MVWQAGRGHSTHIFARINLLRAKALSPREICVPVLYRPSASRVLTAARSSTTATSEQAGEGSASKPQFALYNSLTRRKEPFKPTAGDGTVSMYVCGVTVYDFSHIGHARVYTSFDILYRFLRHLGYKVFYVRNFTDVDDKIIQRAKETGCTPEELTKRYIDEFHTDMDRLNCLRPALEPRATDFIEEIVRDIERIIANGSGYEAGGDVYFDVSTSRNYGMLSGRKQEDNRAGERVAVDARKRNPGDFVLWKAAREGEPQWSSPWGMGRPGWHIECSAMIRSVMGPAIDIHGGGRDLLFPHHENELAQAQAAASECDCQSMHPDRGFVNFWLHNGFVNVDSEKMSKSLGNFFTIRDVLQQYHPLALRFFLISSQYRAPINYTPQNLKKAAGRIYYIYQTLSDCQDVLSEASEQDRPALETSQAGTGLMDQLCAGLSDDLNISPAVSAMSEPLRRINDLCHTRKGKKAAGRIAELQSLLAGLQTALDILGLWKEAPSEVLLEMRELSLIRAGLTEQEVEAAIEERATARQRKDFAAADAVRDSLSEKGIQLMDTPQGSTWRPDSVQDTD